MTMENDLVERLEVAAWEHKLTGIVRQRHDKPSANSLSEGDYEPLVRLSEATARIQALEAELAQARKERDAALDHDWVAAPAYAAKVTMCREFRDRSERAEAELARKTEALRDISVHEPDDNHNHNLNDLIAVAAVKRARSALEEKTDV